MATKSTFATRMFIAAAVCTLFLGATARAQVGSVPFIRGDATADGTLKAADVLWTLEVVFLERGRFLCEDAADVNDNGWIDVGDPLATLFVLFVGGVEIPAPGPKECGVDPTRDSLTCGAFPPCTGNEPPLPSFTVTPPAGETAPLRVDVDGTGSRDPDGTIARYHWDFGDGLEAEGPRVTHYFLGGSRSYSVTLTVTDDAGESASSSRFVRITGGDAFPPPELRHPVTDDPYRPEELRRIQDLFQRYPDNRLVRRALTSPHAPERQEEQAEAFETRTLMISGEATEGEIEAYYDGQEQLVRDRIELVGHVLAEETWDDEVRARHDRIRAAAIRQLDRLARRRARSIAINRRRKTPKPPPVVVATITPKFREVTQGEVAVFDGQAEPGMRVTAWRWSVPPESSFEGPSVSVKTNGLRPGSYEVFLQATGSLGEHSVSSAILSVLPVSLPALDLAVVEVEVVPMPDDERVRDQAQIISRVANLGGRSEGEGTVLVEVAEKRVFESDPFTLGPQAQRVVQSTLVEASLIAGQTIRVTFTPSEPASDPDLQNNQRVVEGPPVSRPEPPDLTSLAVPPLEESPVGLNLSLSPATTLLEAVRVLAQPLPFDLGPIDGFADYHIHQMARAAYDGRLLWGGHDGPDVETALPKCMGTNHAICWLPGWLVSGLGLQQWEIGSHAGLGSSVGFPPFGTQLCLQPHWTGGVGASTKGWHDNPNQAFKHWPIWKTVSHQQVYREWLELAHQQGLNLIVMSAVNSSDFCGLMPNGLGFQAHPIDALPAGNPQLSGGLVDADLRTAPRCSDMRNVRRQIVSAWQFNARHDWYQIALSPGHAEQIILEGRMAVILGIECSDLFDDPQNEQEMLAQLDYFVDELHVRSIQPIHSLDNAFGGAATWNRLIDLIQMLHNGSFGGSFELALNFEEVVVEFWIDLGFARDPVTGENVQGLTPLGAALIEELMDRQLLIDLSHMSKPTADDTFALAEANEYYPMYISHARYKDLLGPADSTFGDHLARHWEAIQQVKILRGVVGLRTGRNRVRNYSRSGVDNDCPGSVKDFAQSYAYGAVGYGVPQGFASDMNGLIPQMRPRFADPGHPKYDTRQWACAEDGASNWLRNNRQDAQGDWQTDGTNSEFDLVGFGHVGHMGRIVEDLGNLGVDTVGLEDSAQSFIDMWERAYYPSGTRMPGDSCLDRTQIGGGPAIPGDLFPGCQ